MAITSWMIAQERFQARSLMMGVYRRCRTSVTGDERRQPVIPRSRLLPGDLCRDAFELLGGENPGIADGVGCGAHGEAAPVGDELADVSAIGLEPVDIHY